MIPFLDLKKINARFEADLQLAFSEELQANSHILGDALTSFETQYAEFCGVTHCIGVSNGLDALRLIFEAYKTLGLLHEGDEVLVCAHTFIATILAIKQAGLKAVLVDANPDTFNFETTHLDAAITSKTKAILAVHLYGALAPTQYLQDFAKRNALYFIEDAAQAHGAQDSQGYMAGSLGDAAAFSFYPAKNLGALGDGGAITTNNTALAKTIKKLRNYGSEEKYIHDLLGFNARLDSLQAKFLSCKLPALKQDNAKRRSIAQRYLNEIKNPKVLLPKAVISKAHVCHLFVIRVENRQTFLQHAVKNKVQCSVHYPVPPHKQDALKEYAHVSLPVCETLHNEVVSLPISPVMDQTQVNAVIEMVNAY